MMGGHPVQDYLLNSRQKQPLPLESCCAPPTSCRSPCGPTFCSGICRTERSTWALVVDEYGGTGGLLPLEDLLEELGGQDLRRIRPPGGAGHHPGPATASGGSPAPPGPGRVGRGQGLELPEEELEELDCDTVGGLVFALLPVIPEDGSRPWWRPWGSGSGWRSCGERRVEWALAEKSSARQRRNDPNIRRDGAARRLRPSFLPCVNVF